MTFYFSALCCLPEGCRYVEEIAVFCSGFGDGGLYCPETDVYRNGQWGEYSKSHGYKSYIRKGELSAGGLASILDKKGFESPKSAADLLREAGVNDSSSD